MTFKNTIKTGHACKKTPSVVFEYECRNWMCAGSGYSIKLLADGTLLKCSNVYPKMESDDRVILENPALADEIKALAKTHRDKLKSLPRNLSNLMILDGVNETVRIGRMKFEGSNMFTEDMTECVEQYKGKDISAEYSFMLPLYKFQKIFSEIKAAINKYCPGRNDMGVEVMHDSVLMCRPRMHRVCQRDEQMLAVPGLFDTNFI